MGLDYTIDTVKDLLKDFCGEKAEEKLERRYQALKYACRVTFQQTTFQLDHRLLTY